MIFLQSEPTLFGQGSQNFFLDFQIESFRSECVPPAQQGEQKPVVIISTFFRPLLLARKVFFNSKSGVEKSK